MKRWLVMTGSMERFVEAETVENACAAAVLLERSIEDEPADLGVIMSAVEVTPDAEVWYMKTEYACKHADLWEVEGGWQYLDSEST